MTSVTSGVVLSAALRSTIVSLQDTQSQINETQLRLATGLKVNSAIDNPQNFFDASALNARAANLSTLLDGIGQSISTLQQSSNAVSAVTSLVEQAQSIANEALSNVSSGSLEARIVGDRDLENSNDLPNDFTGISNNDRLVFSFVEPDNSINTGNNITINNGDSIDDLINAINSIVDSDTVQVFEAQLTSAGYLDIRDRNGNDFEIEFQDNGGNANSSLANALGFSDLTIDELDDNNAVTRVTVSASASLTSVGLYEAGGTIANASTNLLDLTDSAGGSSGDIFDGNNNDTISISVNGGTPQQVISNIVTATLQDLIDGINNLSSLSSDIEATFDATSGVLNIRAIDSDVVSIQFDLRDNAGGASPPRLNLQVLGFGFQDLTPTGAGSISSESFELGAAAGILADLEDSFEEVLNQIDILVADSDFQGINLLEGDSLTTFFNSDRSSSLVTQGIDATSSSLGLGSVNFGRSETIGAAIDDTDGAISSLRSFSTSLSTNLSIIETREDFIDSTITNLEEGANKLTVADQNEEGAKLLALQTRQLLGVTALSLGSLAQQSTLRLF